MKKIAKINSKEKERRNIIANQTNLYIAFLLKIPTLYSTQTILTSNAQPILHMSLRISALASWSTGNVTYIETETTKILLDAWLSGKKIEQSLNNLNRKIEEFSNIFITHEHIDHIRSAGILNRRFGTKIIGNEKTLSSNGFFTATKRDNPYGKEFLEPGKAMRVGDIEVKAFKTSHDTACSQFYTFKHQEKKIACLTDTGNITPEMIEEIKDSNILLIESNHDVDMLKHGSRPESNKQRILSDHGHLSNVQCAEYLSQIITPRTHTIILGHLSHDHNTKELAYETISSHLEKYHQNLRKNLHLFVADADENSALLEA